MTYNSINRRYKHHDRLGFMLKGLCFMCIYNFIPKTMNMELTTTCPLRCPQCYCSLTGGKHMKLETAIHWIQEGGKSGVQNVMLSGGETLCYPYIYDVVAAAHKYCGNACIALSGFALTKNVLDKLIESKVDAIFVSLNGSTESINAQTRDGYELAISALELLKDFRFEQTFINWVMHSNNSNDFANVVEIAEKYNVKCLIIMAAKPDSNNELTTMPTKEQMLHVRDIVSNFKGNTHIMVESCYSPMYALISEKTGSLNTGKYRGCGAGRFTFSVNVDGMLSPCRHLDYFEMHSKLQDYWNESPTLHRLRIIEDNKREPCLSCKFSEHCIHCLAINDKLRGELHVGYEKCPLQNEAKRVFCYA